MNEMAKCDVSSLHSASLFVLASCVLQGIDCALLLMCKVGELQLQLTLHCSYFSTHSHRINPSTLWVAKLGGVFVPKWWGSYGLNGVEHL